MKSIAVLFCCLLSVIGLVGCEASRTLSTVQDDHAAYAIKGADAKRVIDSALANYIPPERIDHSPKTGVVASGSLQSGTATQFFTITALPVSGVNARGEILEGYGFIVTDRGPVVNDLMPRMLYSLVRQQALSYGEVLATAKPPQ